MYILYIRIRKLLSQNLTLTPCSGKDWKKKKKNVEDDGILGHRISGLFSFPRSESRVSATLYTCAVASFGAVLNPVAVRRGSGISGLDGDETGVG